MYLIQFYFSPALPILFAKLVNSYCGKFKAITNYLQQICHPTVINARRETLKPQNIVR